MSIRSRLLMLVLAAILFPTLMMGARFLADRERHISIAIDNLAVAADDLASNLNERILGTVQLQYGLSRSRELDADRESCSAFLSQVRTEYPQYTGILTINPDGRLFCDSLNTGRELDLRDRKYFRDASTSPTRVALEPAFGRLTGIPVLQIAYPARTAVGDLKFVLLASLDLEKFVQGHASRGIEILLVAFDGTVLARSPSESQSALKGSSIKNEPLFAFAAEPPAGGAGELIGVDGSRQVWAIARSDGMQAAGLYVLVSQSRSDLIAAANRRFAEELAVLAALAAFLFLGVWVLAEVGIRRQVVRIGLMAKRLGSGDLQARIPPPHPGGELGGLMTVLNATAASLERQHNAIEDLDHKLRQSQKMEAVGQLTGGVAHDFNNILMVIMANVEALEDDEAITAAMRLRIEEIGSATQRAADLTRQLLAFSRKQLLRPERTDINEIVTTIGKLLGPSLGEQIEIVSILADDLWSVDIDRAQLEAALVNLCLNSRDAMPHGGRLLIETSNTVLDEDYVARNPDTKAGEYAVLAIADTGNGIPPEFLDRVLEPFFTTKGIGEGTGLGLSMVYGFIKQSKGHFDIHSEVGRGTSIKLYLPRGDDRSTATDVPRLAPVPRGNERILVVEDDPQVREAVVRQVKSLGYTVSEASDGAAGLAAFEAAAVPYDVLLTDIVMPGGMNGKALTDQVLRRWPRTKFVYMSGYTENAIAGHGQDMKDLLLLSKPFSKSDLARTLRHALGNA